MPALHVQHPLTLLGLVLVPVAYLLWARASRRAAGVERALTGAPGAAAQRGNTARGALRLGALALLVLALASPVAFPGGTLSPGLVPVVFVLDVSASMGADDLAPDRLTVAREAVEQVAALVPGARTALVAAAQDAVVVCPLTADRDAFLTLLRRASTDWTGTQGTRLAPATAPGALITGADLARLKPYLPPRQLDDLPPAPLWRKDDLVRTHDHLARLLDVVITYLPRQLVQAELALADVPPVGGAFLDGALLFADISGFTAMSERLSTLGQEGAEQITALVNRYFGAMLDVLFAHGGDLFKFGGDALLAFFPDQVGGSASALQAAWAMQEAMAAFHQVETSLGTFPLQMKIGLHAGPIFAARVGSADEREFIVTGPAVNATARAEEVASAGQILVSPTVYAQVQDRDWVAAVEGPAGHYLVERVGTRPSPVPPSAPLRAADLCRPGDEPGDTLRRTLDALERLVPYLPPGLLRRLVPDPGRHETSGEHRLVAVLFANFLGASELVTRLGRDRTDEIAQALNRYFVTMHQAVSRYGGVVNKVDLYDQGDKLMALFGAPVAHEDDAERAVRAALEMQAAVEGIGERPGSLKEGWLLSQRIGVSTGMVFAGHVGAATRREYTVMGDEVNLAARLMSAAAEGEILLASYVQRKVSPFFEVADRGEVSLKGKSKPVPTYTIVGRRAQPEPVRGIRGLRSPLVGRAGNT